MADDNRPQTLFGIPIVYTDKVPGIDLSEIKFGRAEDVGRPTCQECGAFADIIEYRRHDKHQVAVVCNSCGFRKDVTATYDRLEAEKN